MLLIYAHTHSNISIIPVYIYTKSSKLVNRTYYAINIPYFTLQFQPLLQQQQ